MLNLVEFSDLNPSFLDRVYLKHEALLRRAKIEIWEMWQKFDTSQGPEKCQKNQSSQNGGSKSSMMLELEDTLRDSDRKYQFTLHPT